jgi:hypothetical protein
MKKLLLSFTLVSFTIIAYCQQTWAPIGAEWYLDKEEMLPFVNHGYIHYKVLKDTIVNSKSVKLITKQSVNFAGTLTELDTLYAYEENSKIYYFIEKSFLMFYDFGVQVGDTIKYPPEVFNCDSVSPIIVDSIKNINMNNVSVKIVSVSYKLLKAEYNQTIIKYSFNEKLCVDYFYPSCGIYDQFVDNFLRCYHDSVVQYVDSYWTYLYPNAPCDTLINEHVNISELKDNNNIQIYPNPTNNVINIKSKEPISRIVVYDLQGHKMLENNGNDILKADVNKLYQGVYLLKVISKSGKDFNIKIFKLN